MTLPVGACQFDNMKSKFAHIRRLIRGDGHLTLQMPGPFKLIEHRHREVFGADLALAFVIREHGVGSGSVVAGAPTRLDS